MTLSRWLASTSNRTFVVWPLAVLAAESALQQGMPQVHWWAVPVLAWGYLQYRWVGTYRTRQGGGGPGIAIPPERLVSAGPYRWVRNPMYLGHLIFLAGLALTFKSWAGVVLLAIHIPWFDRRAREDESGRAQRKGEPLHSR